MQDLLDDLNPEQRRAVTHGRGPLLVLAGAGSGKTRVITYRLAYPLASGCDARRIVAVTFTNKAASEMRARIGSLLRGSDLRSFVGTFHRWCLRFLRRHAARAGLPDRFSIADTADQLALVREALEELAISEKSLAAHAVLGRISAAKSALRTPEMVARAESDPAGGSFARLFALYQKKLGEAGAVDFDDLIGITVGLLSADERLLAAEREGVRHLLVDEYQDTNRAQDALIGLLGSAADSFCAVGDEDQAIYRWRGAEVEHILRFEEDFPGATVVALTRNYRSTSTILEAASGLVANNRKRRRKLLRAERVGGGKVRLFCFADDRGEAETAVAEIASDRRPASDWAVLFRTNAQTRLFEEDLLRRRIPYCLIGGLRFYERAEVKDALAYLRLAVRPEDDLAFRRVVNVPARGIGAATVDRLARRARERGVSLWEASADPSGLPERARAALAEFHQLLAGAGERASSATPASLLNWLLSATGYDELYARSELPEDIARRENLKELLTACRDFEARAEEGATARDFLDAVGLATDADAPARQGIVTLLTMHAVKGLEFPAVWIAGLEEGLLPHAQSRGEEDELEEERRLLYVAMTRAREELSLSFCRRRVLFGQSGRRQASRFLSEIPAGTIEEIVRVSEPRLAPRGRRLNEEIEESVSDLPPTLRRGRRVRHPDYGLGTILQQEGSGEEARLVVFFDRAGKKKFLAKFARLEPA